MSSPSDFSRFIFGLEVLLKNLPACSLTTLAGDSLFVKGASFSDLGSLPYASYTAQKYFSLQDKQCVILNDPFSGGTILSEMTLVMGLSLTKSPSADLLFTTRVAFRPELNFSETLTPDAFRVPPTPLGGLPGFTKDDVLSSMSTAPKAPKDFKQKIEQHIHEMEILSVQIRSFFNSLFDGPFKKAHLEAYFNFTQKAHQHYLDALPFDRVQNQVTLDDGSLICLSIFNSHNGINFDFSGTTLQPRYGLTNPSVMGICLGALNYFLEVPLSINHGQFKNIAINTPLQSRLNASFPQSTDLGHLMAAPQMINLILSILSKMIPKWSVAGHANSVFMDIQFEESRFFERLAGGLGATANRNGEDGWEIWGRHDLKPSFEEIENRFPMRVNKQERREGSGGAGVKNGGHGLRRSYTLLKSGRLSWLFDANKPSGLQGGSVGDEAQILYTPKDQEPIKLNSSGEMLLKAGDTITILSAGGGGYGRSATLTPS